MLTGEVTNEVKALVLEKQPIEVVVSEDSVSPLLLVLPPYEDIAEVKALQGTHISAKEWSFIAQAPIWTMLEIEKKRLERKYERFADSSVYLNRLANLASIAGDFSGEEQYLRDASKLKPDDFISNRIIENLIAQHRGDEAEALLSRKDLTSNLYANLRLAAIYARREQISQAAERVATALKIAPFDFGARLFDGALKLWKEDYAGAILSFRVASESRPNSAALRTNMAVAYVRMNRTDKALQSLKVAVAIDPLSLNAVTLLADVAYAQGQNEDAIPSLRYFVRYEQKTSTVWGRLARALLTMGETNEAIAAIKRQASLDDDSSVWNNLGVAYLVKGDRQKSLEAFKHAMMLSTDENAYGFCIAARNITSLIASHHRPNETVMFIDNIVRADNKNLFASRPELASIFVVKFQSLVRANRNVEAAKLGEEILIWNQTSSGLAFRIAAGLLALYSLNEGGAERALQIATQFSERALHERIDDSEARGHLINNIAFVFIEHGMLSEAERYLQAISADIHKQPYPTATSGLLHLRKGHLDRAEKLYGESLRLCTNLEDKARIRQKWNLEIGRTMIEFEPRRALRYLVNAKDEAGAEKGLSQQAAKLIATLPRR